jgi:outer membrane protein assembly factor BamE (lipoprotein component of BamABCDE complex)
MVPDAFDEGRWDYLYYFKQGRLRSPEQRHLTIYFEGDKVSRIDHHDGRAESPAVAEAGKSSTS